MSISYFDLSRRRCTAHEGNSKSLKVVVLIITIKHRGRPNKENDKGGVQNCSEFLKGREEANIRICLITVREKVFLSRLVTH